MLFGVCIYSLFCIVCLPICVLLAKKLRKRRKEKAVKLNEGITNFSDKYEGPILEGVEEEDADEFDKMSGVIDLSGEGILIDGMKDIRQREQARCRDPEKLHRPRWLNTSGERITFFLKLEV